MRKSCYLRPLKKFMDTFYQHLTTVDVKFRSEEGLLQNLGMLDPPHDGRLH